MLSKRYEFIKYRVSRKRSNLQSQATVKQNEKLLKSFGGQKMFQVPSLLMISSEAGSIWKNWERAQIKSRIRHWHIFRDKNVGMCHFWNDMGNLPFFFLEHNHLFLELKTFVLDHLGDDNGYNYFGTKKVPKCKLAYRQFLGQTLLV